MLMNHIRPTLALAIASALAAGCQAPATPIPPAPAAEAAAVAVTGSATTPAPNEAPAAAAGAALAGRAAVFGKPLANATIRVFALNSDEPLAEGRADAQGDFSLTFSQAPAAPLLRVVAANDETTLATVVTLGPVAGAPARRVLAAIDVVLSEISTTAYAALYPRLRSLRDLTGAESTKVLAAFSALTSVLTSATEAQRQAAINAVLLRALDANGLMKNSAEVDRAGIGVLQGIPGFTAAFETAGTTLGEVIGAAASPNLTFGSRPRSGGGSNAGAPTEATADLNVTIDLPGQPAGLRLLALASGVANVRVTLSGPSTAELFREPGASEDPMAFAFTGLPVGEGYTLTCRAESPLGQVLGTTSRVLTLDGQGGVQTDAAGRVLEQANFTLQAGPNAVSVRLPLGGPSVQVTL